MIHLLLNIPFDLDNEKKLHLTLIESVNILFPLLISIDSLFVHDSYLSFFFIHK